ncbi:hypothetical protein [Ruminococcus albus]|uniref:WD40-like Beta Propeller Repeat n=1 Tax=Ruminococcus albus TaxID=1264 RepID=A0A1H7KQN2_RUMAL|nr:hypothetical protein [Ruminococcus albus]SEK88257.1 hypothetical protein SAMN05216469_10733 [Ruminococcus albus]
MDKQLYDILDGLTADEMMPAAELLEDMAENCTLSETEKSRILSSVMGKAGFDMNETNGIISENRVIKATGTGVSKERSGARILIRRGGVIAACIALLAAGGVVFSLKNNIRRADREQFSYTENADKKSDDVGLQNLKKSAEQNSEITKKLEDAYPDHKVKRINDDRYLIYQSATKSDDGQLMFYDVPSDSVINTISTDQYVLFDKRLENKIATYAKVRDDENTISKYLATIYDDSGNVLYKYDLDVNICGHSMDIIFPSPSPDGKTLFFEYSWGRNVDDKNIFNTCLYFVRYEDQKNIIKFSENVSSTIRWENSNDLLLVAHSDEDGINRTDLYSLSDLSSPYELKCLETQNKEYPEQPFILAANGGSIFVIGEEDKKLIMIKPDENGDTKIGDKYCSIIEYDLFDAVKDNKAFACVTADGKYVATACISEDNRLISALYEINDDGLNKLKTIENELDDTEFDSFIYDAPIEYAGFNEYTGALKMVRVRSSERDLYRKDQLLTYEELRDNPLYQEDRDCELKTDSINFFE